jgi:hypothetical protein
VRLSGIEEGPDPWVVVGVGKRTFEVDQNPNLVLSRSTDACSAFHTLYDIGWRADRLP